MKDVIVETQTDYSIEVSSDSHVCVTTDGSGDFSIAVFDSSEHDRIGCITREQLEALARCIAAALAT